MLESESSHTATEVTVLVFSLTRGISFVTDTSQASTGGNVTTSRPPSFLGDNCEGELLWIFPVRLPA